MPSPKPCKRCGSRPKRRPSVPATAKFIQAHDWELCNLCGHPTGWIQPPPQGESRGELHTPLAPQGVPGVLEEVLAISTGPAGLMRWRSIAAWDGKAWHDTEGEPLLSVVAWRALPPDPSWLPSVECSGSPYSEQLEEADR